MRLLGHLALAASVAAGPSPSASPVPLPPAFVYMATVKASGDCLAEGTRILHDVGYAAPETGTANLLVAKRGGALGEWYCVSPDAAIVNIRSGSADETKALVADLMRFAGASASPAPLSSVAPDDGSGPSAASMSVEASPAEIAACSIVAVRVLNAAGLDAAADATSRLVLGRGPSVSADFLCAPHSVAINVMGRTKDDTDRERAILATAFANASRTARLAFTDFGVVQVTGPCPDAGRRAMRNAGFAISDVRYDGRAIVGTRGNDLGEFICNPGVAGSAIVNVVGASSAEVGGVAADLVAAVASATALKTLTNVEPANGLGPTTASYGAANFADQSQAQCLAIAAAIFAQTGYAGATATNGNSVIGVGATTTSEAVCLPKAMFLNVAGRSPGTTDAVLQSIVLGFKGPYDAKKAPGTPAP